MDHVRLPIQGGSRLEGELPIFHLVSDERPAGRGTVAIVDDDALTRRVLSTWLASAGFEPLVFTTGREALAADFKHCVAVCLDLGLDDMRGLEMVGHLRARDPDLPIVIVTADRELDTAVEAMRRGAYDYVTKPLDRDRLASAVARASDRRALGWRVKTLEARSRNCVLDTITGQSPPMLQLEAQVERVTGTDMPVCLTGETGTGKELVARAIHDRSPRRKGPFVALNCAALAESLLESELFGHEKGAFTGALSVHRGCFEQAQGGTIFLDELGEMPASVQVKLLRTLQEKTVRRVGGTTDTKVDVRVVAATHRDLQAMVRAGSFREDLYYRLAVFPIALPPLRERKGDVALLFRHFSELYRIPGRPLVRGISADALEALERYRWPGNVRELQNVTQRALLACDGDRVELGHLPHDLRSTGLPEPQCESEGVKVTQELPLLTLKEMETMAIMRALRAHGGSVTAAAKRLGIGRATLYRRLSELNVETSEETAEARQSIEPGGL